MNAVVELQTLERHPAVIERGIKAEEWRTLFDNLYPGAKPQSVLMVWDYCKARKLDPLKKPCHIVPMEVKNQNGDYIWRDVVMPGIYEYRTTATRTGLYLGHAKPEYGEIKDYKGVMAPEWCDFVVYRWNDMAKMRAEFPVRVYFREVVALKKGGEVNARWTKAPNQMLTKCTEAAAIREAFPDELGGTHTDDEMDGRRVEIEEGEVRGKMDPRGDVSNVDWAIRDKHVSSITDILNADKEEADIANMLREYVGEFLQPFPELWIAVGDKLASDKIISKANMKKYLSLNLLGTREHVIS